MPFNSFSKTFSFNVYLSVLAPLKPAAPVRLSTLNNPLSTSYKPLIFPSVSKK